MTVTIKRNQLFLKCTIKKMTTKCNAETLISASDISTGVSTEKQSGMNSLNHTKVTFIRI